MTWDRLDVGQLCKNPHPAAVEWMLSHEDRIDWERARYNTNEVIAEIVRDRYPGLVWAGNNSDAATEHTLNHLGRDSTGYGPTLSANSNPHAIDYLLANRHLIHWNAFVVHDDPRIAKLVMNDWDEIELEYKVLSKNDAVLKRALAECKEMVHDTEMKTFESFDIINALCGNSHPLAVEWLLAHPHLVTTYGWCNQDERVSRIVDRDLAKKYGPSWRDLIQVSFEKMCAENGPLGQPSSWCGSKCNDHVLELLCHGKHNIRGASANPGLFAIDEDHRKFLLDVM